MEPVGTLTRMRGTKISPVFGRSKRADVRAPVQRRTRVLGQSLYYYELGAGSPIVFVHSGLGGAESWLRILQMTSDLGRCVAMDPIGFGESTRPHFTTPAEFDLRTQQSYFDSFMESEFPDERVTLVLSGLGSMIGFHWAHRNARQVESICHMESIFRPIMWPDLSKEARDTLKMARAEGGEHAVLHSEAFFDRIISEQLAVRPSPEQRARLLRLFGEDSHIRLTQLARVRDLPINGYPANSDQMVKAYSNWLRESATPKLLILGEPGYLVRGRLRASAVKLPNQTVVAVHGKHVLQIDAPSGVGRLLSAWLRNGAHLGG